MEDSSDTARRECLDRELAADLDDAWHAHAVEVRRWCLVWMGGRRDEAGEAFSRTWTRAAASYTATRPKLLDRRAWLLTLAYHACMDLHRERTRRGEEQLEPARLAGAMPLRQFVAVPRDPERLALGRELAGVLLEAIEDLPPRLRDTMRAEESSWPSSISAPMPSASCWPK